MVPLCGAHTKALAHLSSRSCCWLEMDMGIGGRPAPQKIRDLGKKDVEKKWYKTKPGVAEPKSQFFSQHKIKSGISFRSPLFLWLLPKCFIIPCSLCCAACQRNHCHRARANREIYGSITLANINPFKMVYFCKSGSGLETWTVGF